MIVIEFDYNVENSGDISMDIFVIGYTNDKDGLVDKSLFEKSIIPEAKMSIKPNTEILDMLNEFVKIAKIYKYNLQNISTKDGNPIKFQLKFYGQ